MTDAEVDRGPEAFFEGHPGGLAVYETALALVRAFGPVEVRTTRSQVAFSNRRGFAYLWPPGRWLRKPTEIVLSIALRRRVDSPRFKEVAHPTARVWMHHLELHSPDDMDAEVVGWLREAYEEAA